MLKRVASPISDAATAADIGKSPVIAYEFQQVAMPSGSVGGMASLNHIDPTAPRVPPEESTGITFRDAQCS